MKLQMTVEAELGGQRISSWLEAETMYVYNPFGHYLFLTNIRKDVNIIDIKSVAVTDAVGW